MIPVELQLEGIGPFRHRTVIDFSQIPAKSLFLISGPTGSGKSFIFDAMCFALFGETPSNRTQNVRSDHVLETEPATVQFVFQQGKRTFKVLRILSCKKPKKSGGFSTTAEKQQLIELSVWPDGKETILAEKKTEVRALCHEVLGFNAEQFMQVVLIPQGRFRELLLADSSKREVLLNHLFQATLYNDIEHAVEEEYKALDTEAQGAIQAHRSLLSSLQADLHAVLPPPEEVNAGGDAEPDQATLDDTPLLRVEQLESHLEQLRFQDAKAKTSIAKASVAFSNATEALADARNISKQFHERDEAHHRLQALKRDDATWQEKRSQLEAHYRAQSIETPWAQADSLAQNLKLESVHFKQAEKRLDKARSVMKQADAASELLVPLARELAELQAGMLAVSNALPEVLQLDDLQEKRAATEADIAVLRKRESGLRKEVDSGAEAITSIQAELVERQKEAEPFLELMAIQHDAEHYARLLKKREKCDAKVAEFVADLKPKQRMLELAEKGMTDLRRRRELGMASELAQELEAYEACPVCGSVEHPLPASKMHDLPSKDEIKAGEHAVQLARDELISLEQDILSHGFQQQDDLDHLAIGHASWPLTLKEFSPIFQQIKSDVSLAEQARFKVVSLQRERKAFEAEQSVSRQSLEAIHPKLEGLCNQLSQLEGEQIAVQRRVEKFKLEASLVQDLHLEAASLKAELVRFKKKSAEVESDIQHRTAQKERAESELAIASEQFSVGQRRLKEAELARAKADQAFVLARENAGFASRDDFVAARRDASWAVDTEDALKSYEMQRHVAEENIKRLNEVLEGRSKPELEPLRLDAEEKEAAHLDAVAARHSTQSDIHYLEQVLHQLADLKSKSSDLERRLRVLGQLAKQVRGKAHPKISLSRFFLAQRLDEVLTQASQRLQELSRGRFILERSLQARNKRGQTGLDLDVFDTYTHSRRPVNTLSGGQMFLASLSLALGLADVVQARSGGIRVDALFIDEGFGSLDEETLQDALKVLNELRRGRMVGIISHVTELKRQIVNQLVVHPEPDGSTVRFSVEKHGLHS